jgi:hypothetical protein
MNRFYCRKTNLHHKSSSLEKSTFGGGQTLDIDHPNLVGNTLSAKDIVFTVRATGMRRDIQIREAGAAAHCHHLLT